MDAQHQLQQDLAFVRHAVEKSRRRHMDTPLAVALIWGTYMLVGFTLIDFAPHAADWFFDVAWFVGMALTFLAGRRSGACSGEQDHALGLRVLQHWAGLIVFIVLLWFLVWGGQLTTAGIGQAIILLLAFAYYMAWVHFKDRVLLGAAAALVAGYIALTFIHQYAWTICGVLVFLAMVGGALLRKKNHAPAN